MTRLIPLCVALCMLPLWLFAVNSFRFRYISLPKTLSEGDINLVITDNKGLLWFTNSSGLHRYDGSQVISFNLVTKPAIVSNAITYLLADKQDNLWIGTQNGLTRFDLRRWTTTTIHLSALQEEGTASSYISTINEGLDGAIYAGTNDSRIYRIAEDRLVPLWDLLTVNPDMNRGPVHFIRAVAKGILWITCDNRLIILRNRAGVYTQDTVMIVPGTNNKDRLSKEIYLHPDGKMIYYVYRKGVLRYDRRTGAISRVRYPFPGIKEVEAGRARIFPLADGKVGIFINKHGFFIYDPVNDHAMLPEQALNDNFSGYNVKNIWNADGKIYFSFNKGIAEVQQVNTPFRNILTNPSSETAASSIRSIYRHPDGTLYIGSYKDGFIKVDENTGEQEFIAHSAVYASYEWAPDRLLLATEGDGLRWYYFGEKKTRPLVANGATSTGNLDGRSYLISLAKENDSMVWAGAYQGVWLINIHTGKHQEITGQGPFAILKRARVNDILIMADKRYFITSLGIFRYSPASHRLEQMAEGSPEAAYSYYCVSPVGNELWAGTNGRGIIVMDTSGRVLRRVSTTEGLAGNAVFVLRRQQHHLIAGTEAGISLISLPEGHIYSYSRLDNLPSNECNHASSFIFKDQLYIGTLNGIASFTVPDLLQYRQENNRTSLHLTCFTTGSRRGLAKDYTITYLPPPGLIIRPGTHYFSVDFGGVDENVGLMHYFFRLRHDEPWREMGQQREISLAALSPGRYMLELSALMPGKSSPEGLLSIPLTVQPAFYQTWWFRLIIFLLIVGLIAGLFRYRLTQLLKEQQLRTKIAGDLHDEVGSSLTRIYMQAGLLSIEQDNPALQKIADSSREALGTMSDIVWSVDPRFDTLADLVSRIRDYLNNLGNELDISCSPDIRGEYTATPLSQMVRQNFFLIFKEAVNNAVRYTSEPSISVTLVFDQQIYLQVANACNEEEHRISHYQGGQGIRHMQLRAERMKGRVKITRTPGRFVLELTAPY